MKNWQVIGIHSVNEVLKKRPNQVKQILLKQNYLKSNELRQIAELATKHKISIQEVGDRKLESFASGHQGVALEVAPITGLNWDSLKKKSHSLVVCLDNIEDPHNLGAILRTAWLMEVDALFLPTDRSAKLSPTAIKIACGGAEHVPVEYVSSMPAILKDLKTIGFWTSGLAEGGRDQIFDWKAEEKAVLVVGAEHKGIRKSVLNECDRVLNIWQSPSGSSYNASVAAALCMSEYRRNYIGK